MDEALGEDGEHGIKPRLSIAGVHRLLLRMASDNFTALTPVGQLL
jgi:hypothetical protein